MINWNYQEEKNEFEELPQGQYRCRIAKTEEKMTSTGKPMISMTLDISGHYQKLFYNLVFDPMNAKMTNQKLTSIFESFNIQGGNMDSSAWIGKVGALKTRVGKDQYGNPRTEVHYFLSPKKAMGLPMWKEPDSGNENVDSGLPPLDGMQF